jgi:hypothetical protein
MLLPAAAALADGPFPPPTQSPGSKPRVESMSETSPTPEMWFYEQQRRQAEDPKAIVRANAQQKAAERRARLAAMDWFGFSNSRPNVSPDPIHGTFAPAWAGNSYDPSRWIGAGGGGVIILQADRSVLRY